MAGPGLRIPPGGVPPNPQRQLLELHGPSEPLRSPMKSQEPD
jgi:hypothetical protein